MPTTVLAAATDEVDGGDRLDLLAHADALAAQDALVGIAHERRAGHVERLLGAEAVVLTPVDA